MRQRSTPLKIVVLGYIVRGPIGGMAWHHLNYLWGLASLGHDVLFLEDSDDYPSCYDPQRHVVDHDPTFGLQFATDAFGRMPPNLSWAYYDAHRDAWHGAGGTLAKNFCQDADLLLNISGVNPLRDWSLSIDRRVFIDTDPLFTQIGHLQNPSKRALAQGHNAFFTFGELLPAGRSAIPDDGFPWQATRQPIAMEAWPVASPRSDGHFTTVMQWDSYAGLNYDDISYGMKSRSFGQIMNLPQQTASTFEIALGGNAAPRQELLKCGWELVNPLQVARSPGSYQDYLRGSKGEFSVAKQGYVASRSGWFSERSACYLASGRPVVVEETGFSEYLPTGQGIWSFCDLESAKAAVESVTANYPNACKLARELAFEYFEAAKVLESLIDRSFNA
jgi:hypothetical protein